MSIESFKLKSVMSALETACEHVRILKLQDGLNTEGMILRHDVDLDVEPAYNFARRLEEIGVYSTFLFLMTCDTYNPSSLRNRRMIRQMAEIGFEIGLHFDPTAGDESDNSALLRRAQQEKVQLEDICETDVRSISLHNPGLNGLEFRVESLVNAYDSRIFGPDIYASDSRMREVNIEEFALRNRGRTSQLLLHPMHYSESGEAYPVPMIEYALRHLSFLDEDFSKNSAYESARGNITLVEHVEEFVGRKRSS